MILHKFLIVLLGLLAIMFIEFGTEIFLRQFPVLFLSMREVSYGGQRDAKLNLPIRWVSAWFPDSTPLQHSSMILAAIVYQRAVTLGFP